MLSQLSSASQRSLLLVFVLLAVAAMAGADEAAQRGSAYEIRKRFLAETLAQPKFSLMRKKMATIARAVARKKPAHMDLAVMRKAQALDAAAANDTRDGASPTISDINRPIADLLFEGDILLNNAQVAAIDDGNKNEKNRTKRQAVLNSRYSTKWSTQNAISYFFDAGVDENVRQKIRMALQYWQENTCVFFQENGNTSPRVRFFRGGGCYSELGRSTYYGSQQDLSIGPGCAEFDVITHEVAHTLGLEHELSRYDRDDWVQVLWDKISAGLKSQYQKTTPQTTTNLNVPYDYGSVMHYSAWIGSPPGVKVLAKKKQYQHTMGHHYGPRFNDLLILNRYYQCSERCTYGANCQNNGFRHPRNCNTCICPGGFGGADCSQRQSGENGAPPSCGETVQASNEFQTLSGSVTAGAKGPRDRLDAWRKAACHFHIQAPPGKRVEIQVQSLGGSCGVSCSYGGTEVKFDDLTSAGARMCCASHISEIGPLVTKGSLAIVSVFSGRGDHSFSLNYRLTDAAPSTNAGPYNPGPSSSGGGGGGPCGDTNPNCAAWVKNGFCTHGFYTNDVRKQYCGRSCGLC